MESLREAIYLVARASSSRRRSGSGHSTSPLTSPCCQFQRFFEPRNPFSLNSLDSTQSGDSTPSSLNSSSSSSTPRSCLSATPQTDSSSPNFPLFPQLPMEIRSNIWKIAAWSIEARIIPIEPDDEYEDEGKGFRCRAKVGIPSLFSACSESRAEVLRFYELKFHAQLRHAIYFNKEKDVIFMSRTSSMFSFLQSTYDFERITHDEYDRDGVQTLALLVNDTEVNFWGEDSLHGYPSWRQVSMAAITFTNLRELRLVYRQESEEYTPDFQRERITLSMFWNRQWSSWQQLRARALQMTRNLVLNPRTSKPPEFVFWSREQLENNLPAMERWLPENFNRRSRGSPEPLYGRNQMSFFEGVS